MGEFDEWLKGKGYMEGYLTDYQDAYDAGFYDGVLLQQIDINDLEKTIVEQHKVIDEVFTIINNAYMSYEKENLETVYNKIKDLLK